MRIAGALFVISLAALPASALLGGVLTQSRAAQVPGADGSFHVAEVAKKGAAKKNAPPPAKAPPAGTAKKGEPPGKKGAPAPTGYAALPIAERALIQFDLAFTGYYNGLINGDFNDKSLAAVKAYQRDHKLKETGVLLPPERAALSASSKAKQEQVGWKMVDDRATGAQVGLPLKQVPSSSAGKSGTRWSSAQGQVQAETFRIREPGTKLAAVYEQQKKEPPNRKLEVNIVREDFFVLSGTQGLKKFYVRGAVKDFEVRGLTILWDQATEGIMDSVVVVMSSAFAPFPGTGLAGLIGPPPRRKVDYGTGIVVSAAGDIITDRQITDGCRVIQISGYGDANSVADDDAAGLSLLRIFGAGDLVPAALMHDGARGEDLTLVGIADPQSQSGGRAASTGVAKLNGDALAPPPQLGFAGAAALDPQGRISGMVALKSPVVASAGAAPPAQATLLRVDTIRRFLDAQSVMPMSGRPGVDAVKASLVRVICVRN
jgi:peptidoglycan hydrolase-like protein with peptidoglycan-binding domain